MRALNFGLVVVVVSVPFACANTVDHGSTDFDAGTGDGAGDDTHFVIDTGSSGETDTAPPTFGFLRLDPSNAVVKIDTATSPPTAGVVTYKAIMSADGTDTDVTATTSFTLDDATLGTLTKNVFTSSTALPAGVLGKTTQVHGQPGNGLANITVIALRVTGDKRDFFFVEPYNLDPSPPKDILKFGTNIKQVDVAFLEDTTASMGGEIKNLQDSIGDTTSGLITKLKTAIPSVGIAIAHHDDFPVAPFGDPGLPDKPYELFTAVTVSAAKAQSAVSLLAIDHGGDLPEAQYEAQYELLTGEGMSWTAGAGGTIAKHSPISGTYGGADYRAGSLPVVVEITDASWHGKTDYVSGITIHGRDEVVDAYNTKIKAKFVGIQAIIPTAAGVMDTPCTDHHSPSCDSAQGYVNALDMATATNSVIPPAAFVGCAPGKCCTGPAGAAIDPDPTSKKCPLVFQAKGCIAGSGAADCGKGVADSIVAAIQAISIGSAFDVTAIPSNDPSNPGGVDAPKAFIKVIRAMDEGDPTNACPKHDAKDTDGDGIKDTFIGVTVGTPVCFEVNVKMNITVPATDQPQFFNAFIDVVGLPGSIKLDRRAVLFLVPPKEPPRSK